MFNNLLFCLKFLFNFFMYKIGIYNEDETFNNLQKYMIDSGPIFTKALQLLLVNVIKIKDNNKEKTNSNNKWINILDSVHPPKNIDYLEIKNKKYKVINSYSLNSGSVAYVYLIKDFEIFGQTINEVIVKKPIKNLDEQIEISINRLIYFINFIKFLLKIKILNNFKNKIKKSILDQTDMIQEAVNQTKFIKIFENNNNVRIPKIYYFDSDNLVMEYLPGKKIPDYLKDNPYNEDLVLSLFSMMVFDMINSKLIHCDLHYGNILINDINDSINLNLIDYGIISEINSETADDLISIIFDHDLKKINKTLKNFTNLDIDDINNMKNEDYIQLKNSNLDFKILNLIANIAIIYKKFKKEKIKKKNKIN